MSEVTRNIPIMAQKPTQPPAFDASTTWQVFDTEMKKGDDFVVLPDGTKVVVQKGGGDYQVFDDNGLPRWKRWVDGTAEFDGIGLRDVVNTNAIQQDQIKGDLDNHREADANRHGVINQRLAALEDAVKNPPFPG